MNKEPKVSCIVIGYNIEQFVFQCLKSILEQDYPSYEVIFVDDGSTDHTLEIAQKFKDVKSYTKENGGIISARAYGVERAKGEYIMFIDGDDYINPDMISSMVNGLDIKNEKIDILFSDQWNEDSQGRFKVAKSKCLYGTYTGEEFIKNILSDNMLHFMFPKLYRRQFIIDAGYLEYPHITTGEDLFSNVCFGLCNPKVKYVNQVNYYYRFNFSSVTRKENPGILQQVKTLELIENYMKKKEVYDIYKEYLEYAWYSYVMLYLQYPFSPQFKKEIMESCRIRLSKYDKNPVYCQNIKRNTLFANILFKAYYKKPQIAGIIDYAIMSIRKIKHVVLR